MAPVDYIEIMRQLHPDTEFSRLEHLATIYHMDLNLDRLVKLSQTFDRETIFIFQSDKSNPQKRI